MRIPALPTECPLCIDGFVPTGTLPVLGAVYTPCPNSVVCPGCDNQCVYPAAFRCLHCLNEHLEAHDAVVLLCPDCGGITHLDLLELDQPDPQEDP